MASRKTAWFVAGLLALLLLGWGVYAALWRGTPGDAPSNLPAGVSQAELHQAAERWQAKHGRPPERDDALIELADSLALEGRLEPAAACYEAIPTAHPLYGPSARLEQAKVLIRLHRAAAAERNLRSFLESIDANARVTPQQVAESLDLLRFLLEVELRFEERVPILRALLEIGAASTFDTLAYCFPNAMRWNGPEAVHWHDEFWREDPTDFNLRVALGRYRTGEGRLDEAREILERCCTERPQSLHAQAALLGCLYEQDDWSAIQQVLQELPPRAANDPWLLLRLRGHFHNRQGEYAEAADCFEQALASDPANAESYQGLARAWDGLNREGPRDEALRKLEVMTRIQGRLGWALSKEGDVAPLLDLVRMCQELELPDRAQIMANLVVKIDPQNRDAKRLLAELQAAAPK